MHIKRFCAAVAFSAATFVTGDASAHVTIETTEAPADSFFRLAFNVGHGCDGAPTTRLRVRIPDGVTSVKPQPKVGWEVTTVKSKADKPVATDHAAGAGEAMREVAWSGGKLLDEHFDQFVMQVRLPKGDPGAALYFPVVQECDGRVNRWIEIPEPGKASRDYKQPAPELRLIPKSR